jgi:alkanesulfonate monooxygenase SsuD/methylene tetrahydromethanopterin reductase-like flavin-dependent oxidoreductase (luciferase family)
MLRQIIEKMTLGSRMVPLVGSPEEIADSLETWTRKGGIGRFNMACTVTPESLENFVDLVVPAV